MSATEWIKSAQAAGWRVKSASKLELVLICAKPGCKGRKALPLDNLGPKLGPCALAHVGPYSAKVFGEYKGLVDQFRRRRRALGLSQEDTTAAAGMTDGYINKLEALDRVASLPMLQLWAETLGLQISTTPAPLPAATLRALEYRKATPYRPEMARFKPQQKALL